MSLQALDNLVRIGQLKAEPRNDAEVARLLTMARVRLADAELDNLSAEGRFSSAYNAAHAAALAALRWHGYRSENRYTVFQSLTHTLGWPARRWRCSMPRTASAISPSTRALLNSRDQPLRSCVPWRRT